MKRILFCFAVYAGIMLSAPCEGTSPKAGMESVINLDLRNIDVIDALKFLSTKADINIVVSKNVSGRVNLVVNDVSIRDVFDIILRSNGLAYDKRGDIYHVMTESEYKALYGEKYADVREVKIFHLQYAIPEQIFSLIETLKSDIGRVLVNSDTGAVMVMDSPEKITAIEKAVKQFETRSVIRVFPINYANAKEVAEQLKSQLDSKKVGSVRADEHSSQVIVQTLPERMKQIEHIIAQLDKKTQEVLIDTKIIKVKLSNELTESVEWEGLLNVAKEHGLTYLGSTPFASVQASGEPFRTRDTVYDGGTIYDDGATSTVSGIDSVGSYNFSGNNATSTPQVIGEALHVGRITGDYDFDVVLNYFEDIGETKIISTPKIVVANYQEAKIHVGEKQAYVTTTTTTGQTTSTVSEEVTFIDVGTQLFVTPIINSDGFITLKVKTEVSNVISVLVTPSSNRIPIVDTSLAETTVMTKDGTTVVIGGLRREEKTQDAKKVPLLGSIPLVGKLFSQQNPTKTRTELLVLMTPRIISGETLVGSSYSEVGASHVKNEGDFSEVREPTTKEVALDYRGSLKPYKKP